MIEIILEGGVIQDIFGIPPGLEVVVKDYDVEGYDHQDRIETDDNGDPFVRSTWA